MDITNPIVVDTLPVGAVLVRATAFDTSKDITKNSNPPVYDPVHNTVTWTCEIIRYSQITNLMLLFH